MQLFLFRLGRILAYISVEKEYLRLQAPRSVALMAEGIAVVLVADPEAEQRIFDYHPHFPAGSLLPEEEEVVGP